MATPIRIKRSSVPGKIPAAEALQYGELAINFHDAELYALRNRQGIGTEVVRVSAGVTVTNILYVTPDGVDTNTGKKLGDAKRTIGAAVTEAREGTIIKVFSGSYIENNPIVLPKQVSIVGESLREVSITPQNQGDLFYVTNGNYISDVSFTGSSNTGAIISFNPNKPEFIQQSPYIRNCTNFIPNSIGIKVDGKNVIGPTKSIVTDSFTQYNANGIGVSVTNEGYSQIVSMYTICPNISVYVGSGGQCDLNSSNSSFGNYGLISEGKGARKYSALVTENNAAAKDTFSVGIAKTVYSISNVVYNNITGIATVIVSLPHNYNVGASVTIGNALFSVNEIPNPVPLPNLDLDNVFEVKTVINPNTFSIAVGPSTFTGYSYNSGGHTSRYIIEPYNGQVAYIDDGYINVARIKVISGGSGYLTPPRLTFINGLSNSGVHAVASTNIENGSVKSVDVVFPGRLYTSIPSISVDNPVLYGGTIPVLEVEMEKTFYTIASSTPIKSGICTITFNEAVYYPLYQNTVIDIHTQSKILASSHGFEYVGTGVTLSSAVPNRGGKYYETNEVEELDGGIVVYTSTDQYGKFKIGDSITIDQTTGTISGTDYNRSLFGKVTPLIIALGGI